jgi:hypothetical protein
MLLNQTFADNRTAETVSAAISDVEKLFEVDLSIADEVVARNETVVSAIVKSGQDFINNAWTSNNWVADWFGYSDADQNRGTDRRGRRDDEDW